MIKMGPEKEREMHEIIMRRLEIQLNQEHKKKKTHTRDKNTYKNVNNKKNEREWK